MSFAGDLFGGEAAKDAAEENKRNLENLKFEGFNYLNGGLNGALGSLQNAVNSYGRVNALGQKYNQAGDMFMNALGLNGAGGNNAATAAFQSSPGYQFKVDQSLDALDRRAASRGLLGSGNNTIDTLNTVHGIADQDYANWLNRLSGLATLGANETNVGAAGESAGFTHMAPVYTNDANAKVALTSGVTNGINSQNTQAANAEMAGSANLAKLGMSLATMAMGMPMGVPGGTSLLGGGAPMSISPGSFGGTGGGLGGLY